MSGGVPCECKPKTKVNWVVTGRRCNYSAFNGYHRTSSDYSQVHCRKCRGVWRTKADYVDRLSDGELIGLSRNQFEGDDE